jgi:hypothetical protein
MFLTFFVFLIQLLDFNQSGRIRPESANFLTISSSNSNALSDYQFSMKLDSDIPNKFIIFKESGIVEITFPQNQYFVGLGLPGTIKAYCPYPTLITATLSDRTIIL